jgi:ribosomal protein S30
MKGKITERCQSYKEAVSDMDAARARGETPNIDAFKRRNAIPELSAEAKFAVQGGSAANQWAQLGAYAGIDPKEVARLTPKRRKPSKRG